jgi:hypothetical protein
LADAVDEDSRQATSTGRPPGTALGRRVTYFEAASAACGGPILGRKYGYLLLYEIVHNCLDIFIFRFARLRA